MDAVGALRCESMVLCEAFVKQCRAENELVILKREMRAFTHYYLDKERELVQVIDERRGVLMAKLQPGQSDVSPTSRYSSSSAVPSPQQP